MNKMYEMMKQIKKNIDEFRQEFQTDFVTMKKRLENRLGEISDYLDGKGCFVLDLGTCSYLLIKNLS